MIGYIYIVYTVYIIYYILLNCILYINNEDSRRNTSYHFKSRDPSPTCGMYVHHINAKPKETDPDTQAQKKMAIIFSVLPWQEDMWLWGPPCQPFSRLSTKRKLRNFNPFLEPNAAPFLEGSRYIRL